MRLANQRMQPTAAIIVASLRADTPRLMRGR